MTSEWMKKDYYCHGGTQEDDHFMTIEKIEDEQIGNFYFWTLNIRLNAQDPEQPFEVCEQSGEEPSLQKAKKAADEALETWRAGNV